MNRLIITILLLSGWTVVFGQDTLLPDTIWTCRVDSLLLDAGQDFDTYLWSTGDTTYYTYVYSTGDYWINVKSGDTIDITDTTYVNILLAKIVQPDTSILCGDTITLNVDSTQYLFYWEPGNEDTDSIVVYPRDTLTYYVTISDTIINYNYCLDSVKVSVEPVIIVDTLIQNKMGCPDSARAEMKVEASGGHPPYEYEWSQGIPLYEDPSIAIGLTDGDKTLKITDTVGCFLKHNFEVKAYPLPEIILDADPTDTIYLQKPFVTLTYENVTYDSLGVDTFSLTSWWWDFGDGTASNLIAPTHTYSSTGTFDVAFDFITFYGCPGSDTIKITVKPVDLKISSVITPNGDGYNDIFEIWEDDNGGSNNGGELKSSGSEDPIDLNEYYLSNTLIIFNRWGEKVFESDNYQNDWDGEGLNDGVYFYVLKCIGVYEDDVYRGSVMILTKNPW
ncbi:MAG: gliding motility-associated C-terminal domain-containing protein [Bacteroidetes bacterium]|nr:gliding motility-associated C-terminal domain-containing protein [Bacteroidota bacterium]MBL7102720.1 gliding motility-associated C-terminal domain-containing protein [Bacteroidales bacterium]